jgi:solute carrier family 25 (adenine nucleotide translocator) protein 4/5/6/31
MTEKKHRDSKKSNFILDFFVAGVAAAIGKTSTAPLERIKLILQNQVSIEVVGGPYKGINDCFMRLVKSEGILSLWRGNIPNVMRYFPNQALNFAFKDTFKLYFCNFDPHKNFWKYALGSCLSGGLAGSLSLLFVHPIDLIRTRLATDNINSEGIRKFNGAIDCGVQIFKSSGIAGLYQGIVVSIIGIFAFRAIYFGGYDSLKNKFVKPNTGFLAKWGIAQLVTVFSGILFYPLDTIRRRIMMESGKNLIEKKYINARDCLRKIYSQETYLGFYKGFAANAVRVLGSSIVLVLYDEFQIILGYEARGGSNN